jgi:hypothetical protein
MQDIKLLPSDPVVFAKCLHCTQTGRNGMLVPPYYSKAYSNEKWNRGPVCENCGTPMTFLYEVKIDDE